MRCSSMLLVHCVWAGWLFEVLFMVHVVMGVVLLLSSCTCTRRSLVLLDKTERRKVTYTPDYVGFQVSDRRAHLFLLI
jgi:hypothetical protein